MTRINAMKRAKKKMRLLRIILNWAKTGGEMSVLTRFDVLRKLAVELLPEYHFKWPQMAWWEDAGFAAYLERFGESTGCNSDRRWAVYQLLRLIKDVPGDTAECGVYTGAMSWLICRANQDDAVERSHHLFDSFEGLSAPDTPDGSHWRSGDLSCNLERVKANLSEFGDALHYYPGWIPDCFAEVSGRRFAFLHIDVDLYAPTREAVNFFYPLLNPGAIVVCDDYGFTSCPGATLAVDEVLSNKPEKMLMLPDGGGFFIKGIAMTAPAELTDF